MCWAHGTGRDRERIQESAKPQYHASNRNERKADQQLNWEDLVFWFEAALELVVETGFPCFNILSKQTPLLGRSVPNSEFRERGKQDKDKKMRARKSCISIARKHSAICNFEIAAGYFDVGGPVCLWGFSDDECT